MNMRVDQCRDAQCRADIIWAVTPGGRNMPVNAEPDPNGTVLVTLFPGAEVPVARVVDPNIPPLGGWGGTLHVSHFATCPAAEKWRTRRRRTT
jgi:hypothetical protein